MSLEWLWGILLVGAMVLLAVAGSLLARRWVGAEVLKLNNEVAGFIYAVIGVVYAVLLGFTAIIVWEQYDKAKAVVEQEANELADLHRDAQTFPDEVRRELETRLRTYARLVAEKEWPAMVERKSRSLGRLLRQRSPRLIEAFMWGHLQRRCTVRKPIIAIGGVPAPIEVNTVTFAVSRSASDRGDR